MLFDIGLKSKQKMLENWNWRLPVLDSDSESKSESQLLVTVISKAVRVGTMKRKKEKQFIDSAP